METTEMNLKQALHLSDYEVKLYVAGLNYQKATLSDLAKEADIPRTAAYRPLKELVKRNLVTTAQLGKRTLYSSIDPKMLKYSLDQDRTALDIAVESLTQQIGSPQDEVSVRYFSGTRGISDSGRYFS